MKTGDHVICVRDEGIDPTDFDPTIPVKGGHYVIRETWEGDTEEPGLCLMLVGIFGIVGLKGECGFDAQRFRLLEEMKEENRRLAEQSA
jgi:hypothetical protein